MTLAQIWRKVYEMPGCTLKELAFLLCASYDVVRKRMTKLVAAGAIFKRKCPGDGRMVRFFVEP